MTTTDLLGTPLTASETAVADVYRAAKELAERDDLPPCAVSNVRVALAALGIAATDLALDYEHLTDQGC